MGNNATRLVNISVITNEATGKTALLVAPAEIVSTFTAEYETAQTEEAIITPGTGCKINLRSVYCTTEAVTGQVDLDFATSGKKVFRLYCTKTNNIFSGDVNVIGAADEDLTLTTTTNTDKVFLIVNYTTCE